MSAWESLVAQGQYEEIARRLIVGNAAFDFDALRDSAFATLDGTNELTVRVEDSLPADGCGGGGYYRPEPPTIYLHPSIWRRDNFTLLHELGHHVQAQHDDWFFILLDLPDATRRAVEEAVCNSFAAQVLMPRPAGGDLDSSWLCHPADVMAGLFARSTASRSAVLQQVKGWMPSAAKWILAVADLDGTVRTSSSTYSDAQPAIGETQDGFANLAREAQEGPVRRLFSEGIEYRSGNTLDDINAEAVLDYEGRFVFVALTPASRFGTGTLVFPSFECANPACGDIFRSNTAGQKCATCYENQCPQCKQCGCGPVSTGKICTSCFILVSPGEMINGTHECM